MTDTITTDIAAWVQSLPSSDKLTSLAPVTAERPTLPEVAGWTLFLFPSGNRWKITGRRGALGIIADKLTADQVATFDPNTWGRK